MLLNRDYYWCARLMLDQLGGGHWAGPSTEREKCSKMEIPN